MHGLESMLETYEKHNEVEKAVKRDQPSLVFSKNVKVIQCFSSQENRRVLSCYSSKSY